MIIKLTCPSKIFLYLKAFAIFHSIETLYKDAFWMTGSQVDIYFQIQTQYMISEGKDEHFTPPLNFYITLSTWDWISKNIL